MDIFLIGNLSNEELPSVAPEAIQRRPFIGDPPVQSALQLHSKRRTGTTSQVIFGELLTMEGIKAAKLVI